MAITLNPYHSLAAAALVLVLGRFIISKLTFLKRFCIPAPVVGGLIFALVHLGLYQAGVCEITVDGTFKDLFMNLFFTSVGFGASFQILKKGGVQVVLFLLIAMVLCVLQNLAGCGIASLMGLDARIGLACGSIPMLGGHGTSAAFGPVLENVGVNSASTVAVAAATFGLVAGSITGGPCAAFLIRRHDLKSESAAVSVKKEEKVGKVDPVRFVNAGLCYAAALGVGMVISSLIARTGITLPSYLGCMLVAALIRNLNDLFHKEMVLPEINAIAELSLALFLAIAMMTLKLWQLKDLALPMILMLIAMVLLTVTVALFVVYPLMGKDYDAAVMSAGLCGFGMGATPNAVANMQACTEKHGPAQRAFFVVPIVGGLFVDFVNSGVITAFLNFLK